MCSKINMFLMLLCLLSSCTSYRTVQRISSGEMEIGLSVVEDKVKRFVEEDAAVMIDSMRNTLSDGPIIMNAIRDSETGEMIATDVINASKVTARFRNVAERGGYVTIGFDVTVPEAMSRSDWQLRIYPKMKIQEESLMLEPIFITGEAYRKAQLRGYQRYEAFISSIITDTTDLVRIGQLELFIERHFPATYAMKNDTSIVPEPLASNLFGVTQREALEHYKKHLKVRRNEHKKENVGRMYRRHVKAPIVKEGIRIDTVVADAGMFLYRYSHTFKSRPGLKKVQLSLEPRLYHKNECIAAPVSSDELEYYISSLSSLVDSRPKYKTMVVERNVFDQTRALIDFSQGSSVVDTSIYDNIAELGRIRKCLDDVRKREELVLDSLVVVASCSPEGAYQMNKKLSEMRAEAVKDYISRYIPAEWERQLKTSAVPENWGQFRLLVRNDTLMGNAAARRILRMTEDLSCPDSVEKELSGMSQYRYLREKIYPKLRSVNFMFYLHHKGVEKDTVHTMEIDSVYMSGVDALKRMDYKIAVAVLRPYEDYNSALAFLSADYNHSALAVLERLDDTVPQVCYLKAVALSRLGQLEAALKYLRLSVAYDPYMRFRANLDPEMSALTDRLDDVL